MCGIVGLFAKDRNLETQLGELLTGMLVTMSDRGPDSAGIAVYRDAETAKSKITIQSDDPESDFIGLAQALGVEVVPNDTHAIIHCAPDKVVEMVNAVRQKGLRIMSVGDTIEIYKEVGLPGSVADRFNLRSLKGSHGIGHTRMATESAVTTLGAHPFSTGPDQCLVHNGSLSNHNSLRRKLARRGVHVETENDTEVAAAYLTWKMGGGPIWARRWKRESRISTGSIPLLWVRKTALVSCATPSPVSPRSSQRRINT